MAEFRIIARKGQQIAAQHALGDSRWQTPLEKIGNRQMDREEVAIGFVLHDKMGDGRPEDVDRDPA